MTKIFAPREWDLHFAPINNGKFNFQRRFTHEKIIDYIVGTNPGASKRPRLKGRYLFTPT